LRITFSSSSSFAHVSFAPPYGRRLPDSSVPGTTYSEVIWVGAVAIRESVTLLDGGGSDVPGAVVIPFGCAHTNSGVLAVASRGTGAMTVYAPRTTRTPPMPITTLR
jgi:hypothetical protein